MATKRSKSNGSPKARAKAAKPKKKGSGNVVVGPVVVRAVRMPINAAAYAKKESEIAQLELLAVQIERKIRPDKIAIRGHRKKIGLLTQDIEENTEERDTKVREEFHFNTNEVRVLRADDGKELDRRTMTAEERKRTEDIEDAGRAGKPVPTNGGSDLTPGEALAAARDVAVETEGEPGLE